MQNKQPQRPPKQQAITRTHANQSKLFNQSQPQSNHKPKQHNKHNSNKQQT